MKIIDCEQYSDKWWEARRGVPTASEMGRIITPKTGKLAAAADGYIFTLLGDLYDVEYPRKDTLATAAMRRWTMMEPEARSYYELHRGVDVRQVGFCTTDDGRFGSSPDGLSEGALELKCPMPATHVEWLVGGTLPDEHKVQCHGHLIVTGLPWCDFLSYLPGAPPLLVRVEPDDFTKKLRDCLEAFWVKYQETKEKIARLNGGTL